MGRDDSVGAERAIREVSIHAPAWGATSTMAVPIVSFTLFQSTRPHGARRTASTSTSGWPSFNPRARMGRDQTAFFLRIIYNVSIHAPAWGATPIVVAIEYPTGGFNPRARMGRDGVLSYVKLFTLCFNPRARMGRDGWRFVFRNRLKPSFNPRARMGRDIAMLKERLQSYVSIHAPAWGATKVYSSKEEAKEVSIHAPAWGATRVLVTLGRFFCVFQSTRPHGARLTVVTLVVSNIRFQSTRPHGARRFYLWISSTLLCFNPRARMGRDFASVACIRCYQGFNPRARMGRDVSAPCSRWPT